MYDIRSFMSIASVYSPKVFINERLELIVVPSKNIFFRLSDVRNEKDLKIKILTWLSRSACKGVGVYWETRIRKIINSYLDTSFEKKDFELIYQKLGNGVNPELCKKFIENGYDLACLDDTNLEEMEKNSMLKEYIIPFLNEFDVIDCGAGGEELEYVSILENEENIRKLNEFLCTVNCWAMISPRFLCPAMGEFLKYCHAEGEGTLDLAYLIYNYLEVQTDHLWFGTKEKKWIVR